MAESINDMSTTQKVLNCYTNGLITSQETVTAIVLLEKENSSQVADLQLFITAMREADIPYSKVREAIYFIITND